MTAPRIGLISYCDKIRTLAHINHELYAREQGYTYIFDIAPTEHWRFMAKIEKIRKLLPLFDWVFWIDDDAFVMDRTVRVETFVDHAPDAHLIFCESPVRDGVWTWISSGNFLIRNTPEALAFLDAVLATPLAEVEAWWDTDRFGKYTRGDQDAMVYQLHSDPRFTADGFAVRLPYTAFNTRPEHFVDGPREHFLVHFTGGDKRQLAIEFGQRFDLPESLTYWSELKAVKGVYRPVEQDHHPTIESPRTRLGELVRRTRGQR